MLPAVDEIMNGDHVEGEPPSFLYHVTRQWLGHVHERVHVRSELETGLHLRNLATATTTHTRMHEREGA